MFAIKIQNAISISDSEQTYLGTDGRTNGHSNYRNSFAVLLVYASLASCYPHTNQLCMVVLYAYALTPPCKISA